MTQLVQVSKVRAHYPTLLLLGYKSLVVWVVLKAIRVSQPPSPITHTNKGYQTNQKKKKKHF